MRSYLSDREAEEFIVYWLPKLEKNPYNLVYFKTSEEVEELVGLDITPKPDTEIRICMVFKSIADPIDIPEQTLSKAERNGFTVVEWGGIEL